MTNQELHQAIKNKQQEIEELFDPTTFVLNPKIERLEKEIEQLQSQCRHDFSDTDKCKICGIVQNK